jgi:type IV pilus assembly protein PilM
MNKEEKNKESLNIQEEIKKTNSEANNIDISGIIAKEKPAAAKALEKKKKNETKQSKKQKTSNVSNSKVSKGGGIWSTYFRKKLDTSFGLDISDSSIELLEFKPLFSHHPRSYSRVEMDEGIVHRGKILDKEELEKKLKTLLTNAKPRKISTNRAVFSLPEERSFTWSTTVSKSLSGSELRNKIFEEAKKVVPLNFKKLYWDYTAYPLPDKGTQYVTFVGIDQETLNDYVEVCSRVGIDVVEFSLVSSSLAKVFLPPKKVNNLIIDVGGELTVMSILNGNSILKFSTSSPVAGDDFTEAIMTEYGVTELEAEDMKIKNGLNPGADPSYKVIVDKIMTKLMHEAKETIAYYEKTTGESIEAVYTTGGTSLMKGFEEEVNKQLKKPVKSLATLPFISNSKIFKKDIQLKLYANAVGNALLGVTKGYNSLSLRKQMAANELNMSLRELLKTGNFDNTKMIFDLKRVTYIIIFLIVVILATVFTLMWLDISGRIDVPFL